MSRLLSVFRFLVLPGFLLLPAVSRADITTPAGKHAAAREAPAAASAPEAQHPAPAAAPAAPKAETAPPASVEKPLKENESQGKDGNHDSPSSHPSHSPEALPAASPPNPDEAFTRALKAYNAGAWEDARREFLAIVEAGKISAPLAHNLGNIEFRRGNPGQAVLWYKRALAIQPFSPETLQNLRTIRRQTAFLSFDPWGLSLAHFKPKWIENGTILTAWTIGLLIVWLAWLTPRRGLRWPLATLLILLLPVLALGSFLTWKLRTNPQPLNQRQIVSNKETNAFAAPAEASSSVMSLPAGSEVIPIETRGNWLYCIIPGGDEDQPLRGWIRSAKLEPLWPYAAGI